MTIKEIKKLWKQGRDIPIRIKNNKEVIDIDWYIWKAGTYVLDIWHWFDNQYPLYLLMNLKKGIKK